MDPLGRHIRTEGLLEQVGVGNQRTDSFFRLAKSRGQGPFQIGVFFAHQQCLLVTLLGGGGTQRVGLRFEFDEAPADVAVPRRLSGLAADFLFRLYREKEKETRNEAGKNERKKANKWANDE